MLISSGKVIVVINTFAEKDNTVSVRFYLVNVSKQIQLFFEVVFGVWLSQVIEFRATYSRVKDMYFQLAVIQKKNMSTTFSFEKYLMCVYLELASSL